MTVKTKLDIQAISPDSVLVRKTYDEFNNLIIEQFPAGTPEGDQAMEIAQIPDKLKLTKEKKIKREQDLTGLIITHPSGRVYDADKSSIDAMALAVTALDPTEKISWVLSDNTSVNVDVSELKEVLSLVVREYEKVWKKY